MKDPGPDLATQSFRSLCETILGLVEREPALKKSEIAGRLYLETGNITSALEELIRDRKVVRVGRYMNALYYAASSIPAQRTDGPLSTSPGSPDDGPPSRPSTPS